MLRIVLYTLLLTIATQSFAQSNLSSDELFQMARKAAFDDDNYPAARTLCKQALQKSPNYTDISVFLGRLYLYDDMYDSAHIVLESLYQRSPQSLEVLGSLFDMEYWSDNTPKALEYANAGLVIDNRNEEFLLKRAKALSDLEQYKQAKLTIDSLLIINPKNNDALLFAERLKRKASKDNVTVSYDTDIFDTTFEPWQFVSTSYRHSFKKVSVIGRVNYANRFSTNALQYEVDAYPDVTKKMYAYVSAAYSNYSLFPNYRFGFSLYRSLPKAFEVDLGFRYLQFSDATIIYTGALGKYYKDYWFSLRTFITPGNTGISQSLFLTTRRYFSSADHHLSLIVGVGASPDEATRDLFLLDKRSSLQAQKLRLEYQYGFKNNILINLRAGYENQEYFPDLYRKDLSFGITLEKRF